VSRVAFVLGHPAERAEAADLCRKAKDGTYVEFVDEDDKRSHEQNRKMWPMLTEIAKQIDWPRGSGMKLSANDFKLILLDALGQEMRLVPNANMNGYVNLGRSSSRLTKREFSDLIELIYAFGAQHEVKFRDPSQREEEAA